MPKATKDGMNVAQILIAKEEPVLPERREGAGAEVPVRLVVASATVVEADPHSQTAVEVRLAADRQLPAEVAK